MKRMVAGLVIVAAMVQAAVAGPLQDANAAYQHGDFVLASKLMQPLAEQGDAVAEYTLGAMYLFGQGVPQDYQQAAEWSRKAAEQGIAGAQYNLALMEFKGQGVQQDRAAAIKWYRRAADQGLAKAEAALGMMYEGGIGVTRDFVSAYMWLELASTQGVDSARKFRDDLAMRMTPSQLAMAKRMALNWKPTMKP